MKTLTVFLQPLILVPVLVLALLAPQASAALQETEGMDTREGFIDLYWDEDTGRLLFTVENLNDPFIYQSSLARGVGSNDLGLDRGLLGSTRLVEFQRVGPKVLLVQLNTDYRALSDSETEQQAVADSFARSVVWGFEIVESADGESGGELLLDGTEFFLRDADDMAGWLERSNQGSYQVDESRSAIYPPRTRAFPDNTEIESIVTFTGTLFEGDGGGPVIETVVPDPSAVTVHLHHSFVRLPDDGYEPIAHDPRSGFFPGAAFQDYASPIGDPLTVRYARRHRLERTDPDAASSPAVEPIVYYVDPGAPEPIRSALIEGALWWNEAFEAAGFENAFQVELLPEGADPMDVRYNTIQWVHRSTRGWSYGYSVIDPRTGEIIKGHVSLGSLRVRQDYMIAEGLLAPYADGAVPETMLDMSLARIRQLSAHEVGHTIGIEHNFAASVNDRSSVMDYPFPLVRFAESGGLDFSDAYGVGIGEWDKRTVNYGYRDFPLGADQAAERQKILEQTYADGLLFVADGDSRNPGTAHPDGNLWDNGSDAIEELAHLMALRAYALDRFDERVLRPGRPMATLEETLVPVYLLHRFQLQAVGKLLGGERYSYKMRGDDLSLPAPVAPEKQRDALAALTGVLAPESLAVPDDILRQIPPRPPEYEDDRERFGRSTRSTFDALAPASALTTLVYQVAFHPARAARMNQQHARNPEAPDFSQLLDAFLETTWFASTPGGMAGALQRQTNRMFLSELIAMSASGRLTGDARDQARAALADLAEFLDDRNPRRGESASWTAHFQAAAEDIARLQSDPDRWNGIPAADVPPGSPIGN